MRNLKNGSIYKGKDKAKRLKKVLQMYTKDSRVWKNGKPDGRNSEWWRTADACNGACIDVKAEDHPDG